MAARLLIAAAFAFLACLSPASVPADVGVDRSGASTSPLLLTAFGGSAARAIVEHFADGTRNGVRIRQIGFGDPSIRKVRPDDTVCEENQVFNDVVCNFTPGSMRVIGSSLEDEFVIGGSNQGCAPTPGIPVVAELGEGNDVLRPGVTCTGDQSGVNRLHPVFDARGENGADTLTGGRRGDTLDGGRGADVINGSAGDDTLAGGPGPDRVSGSSGDDIFEEGQEGARLTNGLFPDVLDGGSGSDTVRYASRLDRVTVRLDNDPNDGESGEGDNVKGIENVTASPKNDIVVGSSAANRLEGSSGDDDITGGTGADTLVGGAGSDVIDARDNSTRDVVRCGDGFDAVVADLQDDVEVTRSAVRTLGGPACERIERFAADDGPPAQVKNRAVRIAAGGSVRLRLACPRKARVACRGTIKLVEARRGRHTLASARYMVKRGRRSGVRLQLSAKEVRRVRARGVVGTVTRERGVSKKGPRSAVNTLNVHR